MEVPYFNQDKLLVAAALAGGNVIATFVSTLQDWMRAVGVQEAIDPDAIHATLISLASGKLDTPLRVDCRLWGERHEPRATGGVWGVRPDNLTLGDVSSAMCRGICENLKKMMPEEIFQQLKVNRKTI